MDKQLRYNDFAGFLTKQFPFKVQKLSVNAVLLVLTVMAQKGMEGVHIVTIRRLIRNIAVQRKR